ncbi:Uncharacterised protein [Chlamydia trachomatis]|nr:Uncharacterised protein [Chlamydia trachomatis]
MSLFFGPDKVMRMSRSKLVMVVFLVSGLTVTKIMESLFPSHWEVRSEEPVSTPINRIEKDLVCLIASLFLEDVEKSLKVFDSSPVEKV